MSLSPRLIAIQGIEFTPVQIAVQGLLDYIAGGGKIGGRSTNTLKLRRVTDGRQRAVGGKVVTRVSLLRARVTPEIQRIVVINATGRLSARRTSSAYHAPKVSAAARGALESAKSRTSVRPLSMRGHASGALRGASHASHASLPASRAASHGVVRGSMHVTGWARSRGRGQKNLTTAQLAAIAALYSDA